ncbi:MAG: 5-formyltetrahydrofolate cyclo-ligase [Betaproteobacteria bacterium]|nr:5-formyltetrahydrofolate cyclo-ligase [Betaproteobacteria bacterium]
MDARQLKAWRNAERKRLVEARLALDAASLERLRAAIDGHLERAFPALAGRILAICWPIRNEYDPRHLAHRLRRRGTRTALPVVVAPRTPLEFRIWKPGDALATGGLDIPYPASGEAVIPEFALAPMNGFDAQGYRLGYGAGFFDRTLAALAALGKKPVAIGVTYELARLESIYPQPYDLPMDYVVTERGVYERRDGRLEFQDRKGYGGTWVPL